jgi:hypothetical protein
MKAKMSITMRCNKYPVVKTEEESPDVKVDPVKVDLTFDIDEKTASCFLLRNQPTSFLCNGFKVSISADASKLILLKDDFIYVVLNTDQVYNDILTAYNRLSFLMKMDTVLSFDFDAAVDVIFEPEDEF